MINLILLIFLLALAAPWAYRVLRATTHWVLGAIAAGMTAYLITFVPLISSGERLVIEAPWAPGLGLNFSLLIDGWSLFMAIIIVGIGSLILIYAGAYFDDGDCRKGSFFGFILLFMGSMVGVVFSNNVILLFIFWELTSLSSYLLIGYDHKRAEARAAALQALLVTGLGGLALLAGLLLMAKVGGSLEISDLLQQNHIITNHSLYLPIIGLVLLGAFTKSAQFPFHFWLPNAMEAPSPVSAYLHSATMVKAGVFLVARLTPALGETQQWMYALVTVGAVTMVFAAVLAVTQSTLKKMLAYSTVSVLGTLMMLLGMGKLVSIQSAIVFLTAHAMYKGALFMIAGLLTHCTGEYDARKLSGLGRAIPMAAIAGVLAAASMIGLIPLFGFIGKEMLLETVAGGEKPVWILTAAVIASSMLLFVVAISVGVRPFFGPPRVGAEEPHTASPGLWLGPIVLGLGGLIVGLFPSHFANWIFGPAAAVVHGAPSDADPMKLALWHGWNWILALSGITMLGGLGAFVGRAFILRSGERLSPFLSRIGPQAGYDLALRGLNSIATAQTRLLQSGYMRTYLLIIMVTAIAAIAYRSAPFLLSDSMFTMMANQGTHAHHARFYEMVLAITILASAFGAVRTGSRLAAVAFLGMVGYGVALIFVFYGAPDLAMTQFLIETLIVVLLVLVLYHLPRFASYSSTVVRWRDAAVAIAFGTLMGGLTLAAQIGRTNRSVSEFFAEKSYSEAHGRNVVNVILVDFRAIDTLGEITVIATAAIGVYALMTLRPKKDAAS